MNRVRYDRVQRFAATNHGALAVGDLERFGATSDVRHGWVQSGYLDRAGSHSYVVPGSPDTWHRRLAIGLADLDGVGAVAGRASCELFGLDGFSTQAAQFYVPYACRNRRTDMGEVHTSRRGIPPNQVVMRAGLRTVRPHQVILDAPTFGFTRRELHNAIDSAIRERLVFEPQLRSDVLAEHSRGRRGSRLLLEALVDTGVEGHLERRFLELVRAAGLARPTLQRRFVEGTRTLARVDAMFGTRLIVEVAGHTTHSTRQQLQQDEQRRTELTLRGFVVLAFTYDDVVRRPKWVIARLTELLHLTAA